MTAFLDGLRSRASAVRRRIAFPEANDPRTLAAIATLAQLGIVEPVAVGAGPRPTELPAPVEYVDATTDGRADALASALLEARGVKGLSAERARALAANPLFFAAWMVRSGAVAGCVAGAVNPTAEVLRAGLWVVGVADGVRTVSSSFYMIVAPFRDPAVPEVLTFTDCAVVRYPSATQLADIAISAARDRRRIVGDEPVLAFLSFSTRGSAPGASVDLIRLAVTEVRGREPALAVDGELQGDAALIPAVAIRKAGGSSVAGRANVLVFPTLDAGNICYKLVERLGGATAVGPIVQGLRRPCNDLSRGASTDDIINVAAITALQAGDAQSSGDGT